MADVLVERLTGQQSAPGVPVEVHLVMSDATLLGQPTTSSSGDHPGHGTGHGTDTTGDGTDTGDGANSQGADHAPEAISAPGPAPTPEAMPTPETTYTSASALCQRCTLTKEADHWRHHATAHRLDVTTPPGHTYHAPTRPLLPTRPPTGSAGRGPHTGW